MQYARPGTNWIAVDGEAPQDAIYLRILEGLKVFMNDKLPQL